ncbi:MAG: hypothetical protein AABZ33_11685 [Chloroflexota bacterium]
MSDAQAGPAAHDEHSVGPHGATDDHGAEHGHDDHGHAHGSEALGPLDPMAWGAGALGIALGLVVAFCMVLATSA